MKSLAAAALLCCPTLLTAVQSEPRVTVRNGTYEGLHLSTFNQDAFLGIPYAQNAGGQNRFRIPQALNQSWSDTRLAKNYSDACPDNNPSVDAIYGMSENRLNINLVKPAGLEAGVKIPVALWDSRRQLPGRPIIGTSINYRKGGWGNMYSIEIQGSGNTNIALRDMQQALAWISENVAAFGGDPDCVTIWGESSGSFAVGQLLLTYGGRTDGLFHRSIQESGSAATAWYNGTEWYQPIYNDIISKVNCSGAVDTLACLRTVPYETIYPHLNSSTLINGGPGWYPTVDGDIIPIYPTEALHSGKFAAAVPHLYGTNSDEGTDNAPPNGVINTDNDLFTYLHGSTGFDLPSFAVRRIMELYPDDPTVGIPLNTGSERFSEHGYQYKRIAAILGDVFYHAPRRDDAMSYTKFASGESKTYSYRFNTRAWVNGTNATFTDTTGSFAPAYKGVAHASEITFVFNNPD